MRHKDVNAMLLNEFLKEHRKVKEQQATFGQMNKRIGTIEKGSAQVALRKRREINRQPKLSRFCSTIERD